MSVCVSVCVSMFQCFFGIMHLCVCICVHSFCVCVTVPVSVCAFVLVNVCVVHEGTWGTMDGSVLGLPGRATHLTRAQPITQEHGVVKSQS